MKIFAFAAVLLLGASLAPAQNKEFDDLDAESAAHPEEPGATMAERVRSSRERMRGDVEAARKEQDEEWTRISEATQAQYRAYEAARAEQYEAFRRSVARQWTEIRESTRREWVDYGEKGDARSAVDFEKGKIRIEVLVPVEDKPRVRALAEEKIRERMKKVLAQKEPGGAEVLKDQVRSAEGKPVTEKEAERFVQAEVAPKMAIEDKPVVAQDGKPRLKVTVLVDLVPGHLKVRAGRYKPLVDRWAAKYALAPELIYALIQTESEFNPMARSPAGALGLMQLVPRAAANEAYLFLYKKEKMVADEYLYDPENNIKLGATYLHMLHTRHYGKIKDPGNRRTLSIAAYNCGPGNVRKLVTAKGDPDALSNGELVALIRKNAPRETAVYVPRVQERIPLYRGF